MLVLLAQYSNTFTTCSQIDENKRAPGIAEEINILKALGWLKNTWKSVGETTLRTVFKIATFQKSISELILMILTTIKNLADHLITQIDENKQATGIVEEINILKALGWLKNTWKSVGETTLRTVFKIATFQKSISELILMILTTIKNLADHLITQIDENKQATGIVEEINILKALDWLKNTWKSVSETTLKTVFEIATFRKSISKLILMILTMIKNLADYLISQEIVLLMNLSTLTKQYQHTKRLMSFKLTEGKHSAKNALMKSLIQINVKTF